MSELSTLEARLEAALVQLATAIRSRPVSGADASDGMERINKLEAENTDLSTSLQKLQKQRQRDVADLDALLEQLKPLVEEAD